MCLGLRENRANYLKKRKKHTKYYLESPSVPGKMSQYAQETHLYALNTLWVHLGGFEILRN